MDYTQKHHLPQWVRSDRIMMEDFNDAMANIEKGLTGVEQGLKDSSSASAQAHAIAWDALLRSGRSALKEQLNQFSRDSICSRNGLLFNPLSSAEMADAMSGTAWHERLGVYAGWGEYLPDDVLLSCCTSCQTGSLGTPVLGSHAKSFYEFTAPLTGTVKSFNLYLYTLFNPTQNHIDLSLTLTVEQLTGSGSGVKLTRDILLERDGLEGTEEEIPIDIDFPIVKGNKYRLHLSRHNEPDPTGQYGFLTSRVHSEFPEMVPYTKFYVVEPPITSASHTRSFPTEGPASHAIAVVRFRKNSAASSFSVALGGHTMYRTSEETVTGWDGDPCQERWFAAEGSWDGDLQLKITLRSAATDNIQLLEYAVMLL